MLVVGDTGIVSGEATMLLNDSPLLRVTLQGLLPEKATTTEAVSPVVSVCEPDRMAVGELQAVSTVNEADWVADH